MIITFRCAISVIQISLYGGVVIIFAFASLITGFGSG
jgi:hypothetical protein